MCCGFLSSWCEVAVVLALSHRAGGMGKGRNWEHRDRFNNNILGPVFWMHQFPYLEGVPIPAMILQAQAGQRGTSCTCVWSRIQDLNTFLGENSLPDPE